MRRKRKYRALNIEDPRVPLTAQNIADFPVPHTRQQVSPETILGIPAIYGGLKLLATKISAIPLSVYKRATKGGYQADKNHAAYTLLTLSPNNSFLKPCDFHFALIIQTMVWGNGFARVVRDQATAKPVALELLDASTMKILGGNGSLYYVRTNSDGSEDIFTPDEIVHIKNFTIDGFMGTPLHKLLGTALGLSLAIQKYAESYFRNNCKISLAFKVNGRLSQERREQLREEIDRIHRGSENAFSVSVLEEGSDIVELGKTSGEQGLVAMSESQIRVAAQILGVPASYLGISDSYTSHNSLESQSKQLLSDCINPILVQIEQAYDLLLLSEVEKRTESHFVEFDRSKLIQIDEKVKEEILTSQLNNNQRSWEEYREEKNLSTDRKGTWFRTVQTQLVDSDFVVVTPEPPTPPPVVTAQTAQDQPQATPADQPEQRSLAEALTLKSIDRLIERARKSVEAGKEITDSRSVFVDNLDCFDNHEQAIDSLFGEIKQEVNAILKEDIPKINWDRYKKQLIEGLLNGQI